ncbi:MAG: discoidin domain-containing protein, partial [Dolichospermum sp.]
TLTLPINLKFKAGASADKSAMFGLIPVGGTQTPTNWNDQGYKFYLSNNTVYGYFPTAWTFQQAQVANELYEIDINASGVVKVYVNGILKTTFNGIVSNYKLDVSANLGSLTFSNIVLTDANYKTRYNCTQLDTDNDGVPNRLDVDSDGDGCSDAKESSTTTSTTANYAHPAPYGANGFTDALESSTESGVYNATYTYNGRANDQNVSGCLDTDGDGIIDVDDLDDDNDGVLDTIESSCTSATSSMSKAGITITSSVTWLYNGSATFANLLDGVDGSVNVAYPPAALSNQTILQFNLPSAKSLDLIELGNYPGQTPIVAGGTYKIQGSNNATTWTDIVASQVVANNTPIFAINNSIKFNMPGNFGTYKYYRIYGISVSGQANWANEVYFRENNCVDVDTDNDGVPNRLDLDSDGDGCSDAQEANVSGTLNSGSVQNGSGGSVSSTTTVAGAIAAGPYGSNGLADGVETSAESGVVSYISKYATFATDTTLNTCVDTDNDGVADIFDLDDDNDGVLDTVECPTQGTSNNTSRVNLSNGSSQSSTITGFPDEMYIDIYSLDNNFNLKVNNTNIATVNELNFQAGVTYTTTYANVTLPNGTALQGGTPWSYPTTASRPLIRVTINKAGTVKLLGLDGLNGTGNYQELKLSNGSLRTVPINLTGSNTITLGQDNQFAPTTLNAEFNTFYYNGPCDTDGDGIPNRLDLDSDGDGCSDAKEAKVTTSTTANYVQAGPYGANGFADALESSTESGVYNATYTYNGRANDQNVSGCLDTDGDGIIDVDDLDDDNDGVLDTIESSCTSATSSMSKAGITITSSVTWLYNGSATFANLLDGVDGSVNVAYPPAALSNQTILQFNLPSAKSLDLIELGNYPGQIPIVAGGTYKIQGSNDGTSWTDIVASQIISNSAPVFASNNSIKFSMVNNDAKYSKYRIYGINATGQGNWANEVYFREFTCIDLDTDNDGIPNRLDLDSDGDGCNDAVEGGSAPAGTSAPIAGPFGANGFADNKELNAAESGKENYTVVYNTYAIYNTKNYCLDSDNDGVVDDEDLDDDNDGVLDTVENYCGPDNQLLLEELTSFNDSPS